MAYMLQCYKMIYYTLYLSYANRQKSCCKIRIYTDKGVLIDNGTGKSRKIIDMSSTNLTDVQRQALAGMHAFSGNDCVCLFSKGKAIQLEAAREE